MMNTNALAEATSIVGRVLEFWKEGLGNRLVVVNLLTMVNLF